MASGKSPKTLAEIRIATNKSYAEVQRLIIVAQNTKEVLAQRERVAIQAEREHEALSQNMDFLAKKLAKNIAKQIGVEIEETHKQEGFVYKPDWISEEDDKYDNEHFFEDWQEALERVEWYQDWHASRPKS